MARRGAANEDLSNIEFETSEDVEVVPTFNSMVSVCVLSTVRHCTPAKGSSDTFSLKYFFNCLLQGLREELLRAIYAYGEYSRPNPSATQ